MLRPQVLPVSDGSRRDRAGRRPDRLRDDELQRSGHGRQIQKVVFYLNGKKVKTLTRPNRGTRFALPVRPNTLRRGTHRVLAVTYFTKASGTKSRTLRVVFQRCGRVAAAPRFTG